MPGAGRAAFADAAGRDAAADAAGSDIAAAIVATPHLLARILRSNKCTMSH